MMMMKFLPIILFSLFLIIPGFAVAQQDTTKTKDYSREEILKMTYDELLAMPFDQLVVLARKMGVSIDQLLKMKTTVASKTELTPRETPGIVSIITEEEIRTSGARDLIDVLRLVPGINFGYDAQGVIGLQMRGNWGHEGKILLIVDGIEFNELNYNNNQFGRHFDVNQIKKIEVIRGPGSSIYGGSAELGVINIITKSGDDINGVNVYTSAGRMENAIGHVDGGINAGIQNKDISFDFKGFASSGNRSDQMYQPVYLPGVFDLANGGAKTSDINLNTGIKYKNISARFLYDSYGSEGFHDNLSFHTYYFKTLSADIKYNVVANSKLTITPEFSFHNSLPYFEKDNYLNKSINRYAGNLTFQYNPTDKISIVGGSGYFYDDGKPYESTDSLIFNGQKTVSYQTFSVFLESIIKTDFVNFIVGGRYDHQNQFGPAFAPRVGITKIWNSFHFKMLYSGAFRSPSIGNLVLTPSIKPERTTVAEIELGYKLNNNMFVTANLFNIVIKDPITFTSSGKYKNDNQTGSSGFEIEYKMKYIWGSATLNYSFYISNSDNPSYYKIKATDDYMIGAPINKFSFLGTIHINKRLYISPSLDFIGDRHYLSVVNNTAVKELKGSDLVFTIFVNYKNLMIRNLNFGIGVYDLLNTQSPFMMPYQRFYNPFPGASREFSVKLTYNFENRNR